MRRKTPKIVVSFATTSDAMAVEAKARETGLPGRMIPVPSAVSAGCGLAWCTEADDRALLEEALVAYGLAFAGLHEVELY